MELGGVKLALVVTDNGNRRIGRCAEHLEALWQHGDAVAVAHPHGILFAFAPHVLKQWCVTGHRHFGAAEFAMMPALDLTAQLGRHGLLAVANSEHRNARFIDCFRRQWRILIENRRGPALRG
jgi:hypothetical protein